MTASETRAGLRSTAETRHVQFDGQQSGRAFRSILYGDADPPAGDPPAGDPPAGDQPAGDPDFFADLNLDQVLRDLTAGREGYDLGAFFCTPAGSLNTLRYRQDVLQDLDDDAVSGRIRVFADGMTATREKLKVARGLRSAHQRAAWILDAAATYCATVTTLAGDLAKAALAAEGWLRFRDHLAAHVTSAAFTTLSDEIGDLRQRLSGITYCVRIKGGTVGVSGYDGQTDYTAEVTEAFAKFRQGDVEPRRFRITRFVDMNHVEAQVLDRVALLFPDVFGALGQFADRHGAFIDETIGRFDREVQFYLAYLQLIAPLRDAGLPFCRPEVFEGSGDLRVHETFDLALAGKVVAEGGRIVRNDIELVGPERILVVTGPNQGGKTTFARTFGQLPHLAALGLLVPGTSARLPLADRVFTQFERGENMADLSGKLADDLTRIHGVLEQATERSVVVVNEIFTSTTLEDARFLGEKVLRTLVDRGCLGVYVTFVDELASLGPQVVSMVSTVEPDNPAVRTLKVVRRPADGLAYADVLARKYGLTFDRIAERVAS